MDFNKKSVVVVDVQFVVGNHNQMFIKELAVLESGSVSPKQFYFKPPFSKEELNAKAIRQGNFNYEFINGLSWTDGLIEYNQLSHILARLDDKKVYVKGEEKVKFLRRYLPENEIVEPDIPKLNDLKKYKIRCEIHGEPPALRCAVHNCVAIYMYLLINKTID